MSSADSFLVNLQRSFNVTNAPLAVFILITICLGCIFLVVMIFLAVRYTIHRHDQRIGKKERLKSIYLDELNNLDRTCGEQGQLSYTLEYIIPEETLNVVIGEARDLSLPEDEKSLDVYATLKVAAQHDGKFGLVGEVHRTETKRRTTFPRWYHKCHINLTEQDLTTAHLIFEIFDYDSIGQDKSIGVLDVPLSSLDQSEYVGNSCEYVGDLSPGAPKYTGLGELCVGLTYNIRTERLEVNIYEARQLKLEKVLPRKQKVEIHVFVEFRIKNKLVASFESTQKTELVNPYFNEKASFTLKEQNLYDACCICRLRRKGRFGRRHELGILTLGPNADMTTGAKHWEEMIRTSPRTHVMWHTWAPKSHSGGGI